MFSRVLLVWVTVVSLVGAFASTAAAAGTWAGAAADPRIAFPVYHPTQELGLKASVARTPCGAPTGPYQVVASYRKAGSPARVTIYEASPQRCGDPGESLPVKHVTIGGRSVQVNVFCRRAGCPGGVSLADGVRQGYLLFVPKPGRTGVPRTDIEIMSLHLKLSAVLRLARSLQVITRPKGPWPDVHLGDFLSPDGAIWCLMDDGPLADRAWCVTQSPEHSGAVRRDGTVELCPGASTTTICTQNWGTDSPRLQVGQSSVIGPYRCTGAAASVTCTVTSGAGAGNGFTIDAAGVTKIPPVTA